jgi:anti-sigma B factor antagonist
MEINRSEQGPVTVVRIQGVIKLGESARLFSKYLREILDNETGSILIDMSGIDYVDSTGLGELVGYLQRFSEQGRRLALMQPPTRILNLLKLTKLDEVFQIYDDEATGVAALTE